MAKNSYTPIPVAVARDIGLNHRKDMVVILAYDHDSERTNTVTWGHSPEDKAAAATVADVCAKAAGADISTRESHQDYRYISEGERAQLVDELVKACRAADHAIASVMAVRDGASDELLQSVRDAIQTAISKV